MKSDVLRLIDRRPEGLPRVALSQATASGAVDIGGGSVTSSATDGQLLIGSTGLGMALGTLTAGTGISITNGAGSVTVTNTGVTSLAGTANRVSVSGATGAVTLDLPQDIHTSATPTFSSLILGASASTIRGGATSFAIRDFANGADNLLITNAGAVSVRNTFTVTAGGAFITGTTQVTGAAVVTSDLSSGGLLSGLSLSVGTGGASIAANPSGFSLTVNAAQNVDAMKINGHPTSGQSFGLLIDAGSTSADFALSIRNYAGSQLFMVRGDGLVVASIGFSGSLAGNASTATLAAAATVLATPRAINGVAFDGSGPITVTAAAGTLTGGTLAAGVTASSLTSVGTLTSLGVTGTVTAGAFSGPLTGAVTGNASTATALQTPRAINGVAFDGTAPITVTAAAGTLTGATLAAGVTASSLTSVGTLTSLVVAGTGNFGGSVTTAAAADIANQINVTDNTHSAHFFITTGDGTAASSSRFAYLRLRTFETSSQEWRFGLYGTKDWTLRDETVGVARLTVAASSGTVTIGAGLNVGTATGAATGEIKTSGTVTLTGTTSRQLLGALSGANGRFDIDITNGSGNAEIRINRSSSTGSRFRVMRANGLGTITDLLVDENGLTTLGAGLTVAAGGAAITGTTTTTGSAGVGGTLANVNTASLVNGLTVQAIANDGEVAGLELYGRRVAGNQRVAAVFFMNNPSTATGKRIAEIGAYTASVYDADAGVLILRTADTSGTLVDRVTISEAGATTVAAGINVGTATGAATGEISMSGALNLNTVKTRAQLTSAIKTVATTIIAVTNTLVCMVQGQDQDDYTRNFGDIIRADASSGTVQVMATGAVAGTHARVYSMSGSNIQLVMTGYAGTNGYRTRVLAIGA